MKGIKVGFLKKMLLLVCSATVMTLASQGLLAKDFAAVKYFADGVAWDAVLPEDAVGVEVNVVYTPTNVLEDSYLDTLTFKRGEAIQYPFFTKMDDGTYTWELRLVRKGEVSIGFKPSGEEGPIDENGRQIAIVGEPAIIIEGRTIMSNSGRDSIQTGSFQVVRGVIPEFELPEEEQGK